MTYNPKKKSLLNTPPTPLQTLPPRQRRTHPRAHRANSWSRRSTVTPPSTQNRSSSPKAASRSRRSATSRRWAPSRPATPAWSRSTASSSRACAHATSPHGMRVVTEGRARRHRPARGLRSHPRRTTMLYCTVCDNNNQNCTVHNTTADARRQAPGPPLPAQALRAGPLQPLLPLRSRPVHPLRPLRRSLPERAGQRDPHHRLGDPNIRACCGMAATTRSPAPAASPAATASPSAPATR